MSRLPFQIEHLQFIIDAWTLLSQPIEYLRDPKPRMTRLTNAMNTLIFQSEEFRDKTIYAELTGQRMTNQADDWLNKVSALAEEVSKVQTDHQRHSFRWSINRGAERCLADISALGKDMPAVVATNFPPNKVQKVSAEAAVAMDHYLAELQDCLEDDRSRIIGIWGMGGVGKTNLLRQLNNQFYRSSEGERGQPMFNYVIWAVASKDYKLKTLQLAIAVRLGLPLRDDSDGQSKVILNFLKNKSFLLLLDDLWQRVDLEEVGIPPGNGATKQKVIFTTRLENVCGTMEAQRKIKVECLNEANAWQLFQGKVGAEALKAHRGIPELAQVVAKECDGLPLALVVIGSAMRTKKTPIEWINAITLLKMSRMHEIQDMDDKFLPRLKFSYDNLFNDNFRKCFLLCSLWPEDHSISKTDLIECWMGHGLVDERKFNNINEAYDSGHTLICGLQAACLLEPGDDKDREVKMHDVIRDLALWISSDCGKTPNRFIVRSNFNTSEDSQRVVERISLVRSDELSDASDLPANCSRLETLILQESISFKSIVSEFLKGTRALTYLDISYTAIDDLPEAIGLLGNLRYLNLSHTNIYRLPCQIDRLRELRFLLLRDLGSIDIRCGVLEKLVMLSLIDMTNTLCNNWQELSRLRRRLKGVGIVLESIEDLHQLAQLPNVLTWRLVIRKLGRFNDPMRLLSPSLLGSRSIRLSIQMLKIQSCEHLEVVSMESDGDGNIQNCCLSRLEEVELSSLPELNEIIWRGISPAEMLPRLTVLTIYGCHKLSNISWVIRLPSLEDLTVQACSDMEQLMDDNEFAGGGEEENRVGTDSSSFPSLRRLNLSELNSLRMFGGSFTFPSLEVLQVIHCPEMKTLPFGAEIAGKKLKMICGDREWWNELDMEDTVRTALLPYFKRVAADLWEDIRNREDIESVLDGY